MHQPLSLILLAAAPGIAFSQSPFGNADLSQHIAGPVVDAAWFEGKVIFLEYFGVN